ncbi:MAG: hypothetical protein MSG64_20465 [Pyrinomonadaceae bacterium MAG19_C2-C3]|nr:hypothetical protein [Pyrinomonadaceae bacterium MAG19_C2-C3]
MSDDNGDDRRQRQMDFILDQQAQFAVDIQLLKEQTREQKTIADLILAAQNNLTATMLTFAESVSTRFDRQDAEMTAMRERHDRQDARIAATTESVSQLSTTVDRYIKARGNGSNGQG